MADGELLSELSGKYSFTIDRQVLAVNNHSELNGLFWDRFVLTIHNFNSSTDDGYYWCQIVANGTCPLEPSPTGYLALDQFPVEKCPYNLFDFTDPVVPPICAEHRRRNQGGTGGTCPPNQQGRRPEPQQPEQYLYML